MRVVLIRHGQTPSNVLGLLDTAVPGPDLTDLGQRAGGRAAGDCSPASGSTPSTPRRSVRAQLTAAAAGRRPRPADPGPGRAARDRRRRAGDARRRRVDPHLPADHRRLDDRRAGRTDAGRAERAPRCSTGSTRWCAEAVDVLREAAGDDGAAVLVAHGAMLRLWATVRAADLATLGARSGARTSPAQHRDDRARRHARRRLARGQLGGRGDRGGPTGWTTGGRPTGAATGIGCATRVPVTGARHPRLSRESLSHPAAR